MPVVGKCLSDTFAAHGLHGNTIGQAVAFVGTSIVERQSVKEGTPALRNDVDIEIVLEMKHRQSGFPT